MKRVLSPCTAQDHVAAIFAKIGVREPMSHFTGRCEF